MVLVDDNNVQSSYVIIDDVQYLVENPLKALDVCFKCCFALQAKYPFESQQVWMLIQKLVYKIQTPSDNNFSVTTTVMCEITNEIV